MAHFRGWQTTVVHLGFVNRLSVAGNAEITGKSHEIVKLAVTGKLNSNIPLFHNQCYRRNLEDGRGCMRARMLAVVA